MKITIILLTIFIAFLQLLRLDLINNLVPSNTEYVQIQGEIDRVKKENMLLGEELLRKEALVYINEKAKKEGYVKAKYLFQP